MGIYGVKINRVGMCFVPVGCQRRMECFSAPIFFLLLLVIVVIEKISAKYSYKLLGAYLVVIFPRWDLLKNGIVPVIQRKAAF